jgi:signal transduction histidine kinase
MEPAKHTLSTAQPAEPREAAAARERGEAGEQTLEQEQAQEHRLAAQMRALAEIAPAVAHDLRAPINAMVLNLEVLRETISGGRAGEPGGHERLLRYTGVLRDELARLHRSLEVFLGHISPRSDRTEALDLRDLASELAALLTAPARKRQIEVAASLPAERVVITANPYLLRQALLHFGLAALAAVPQPGRLEVTLGSDHGRARLRIAGRARETSPAGSARPAAAAPPLERLEVARSLLAAQRGTARICGARAEGPEGPGDAAGSVGETPGFELELPLSSSETR